MVGHALLFIRCSTWKRRRATSLTSSRGNPPTHCCQTRRVSVLPLTTGKRCYIPGYRSTRSRVAPAQSYSPTNRVSDDLAAIIDRDLTGRNDRPGVSASMRFEGVCDEAQFQATHFLQVVIRPEQLGHVELDGPAGSLRRRVRASLAASLVQCVVAPQFTTTSIGVGARFSSTTVRRNRCPSGCAT